jgi:peptidoglycan/xylan/chitin deacetylase (PgdA/CDA1 family)
MTTVCLTFDFDGIAVWLSTFKQSTPTPLSRGEFGARVGIDRLLGVLQAHNVPATFFVPAHSARSFPETVKRLLSSGHEVGCHGYIHESPVNLPPNEERDLLARSEEVLSRLIGCRPRGYRSPAWDLSPNTIEILESRGYLYDSSLMADDFRVYRPRKGDQVDEQGLTCGQEARLVEFPVAWELDDYPYFHFSSKPLNQGLRSPDEVLSVWRAEFDYCHSEVTDGVFTLTMHPEIIGRGPRIRMLAQLIEHMRAAGDVQFSTMGAHAARLLGVQPNHAFARTSR